MHSLTPPSLRALAIRLVTILLLPLAASAQPAPQDNWTLDRTITVQNFGAGLMNGPYGVTILSSGKIAVVEHLNHRIHVFDANGNSLATWGSQGSADGQFVHPWALTELKDGSLAVSEYLQHRIQVFSPEGTFLRKWGSLGSGDGQFNHPGGMLVLANGHILVCEIHNQRVQVFEPNGTYVRKWSVSTYPKGAALLQDGRIAITCAGDATVKVYNPDGTFVRQFGSGGIGDAQFNNNYGIAVMPDGKIIVTEASNHRVQILYPDGSFVRKWGREGSGDGEFRSPIGLSVTPDGRILVADAGNNRIQIFNSEGVFQGKFGTYGTGGNSLGSGKLIDADAQGNLLLLQNSSEKPHVTAVGLDGRVRERFRFSDTWYCVFRALTGKFYVGYLSHIEVYSATGAMELRIGTPNSPGTANGQFGREWTIPVADASGNIYVADRGNSRVQKFSSTGAHLSSFGEPGTGPGQFADIRGIGILPDGNIFVGSNSRLQVFSPIGTLVESTPGSFGGDLDPISFAPDGFHYHAGRLFRSDRTAINQWSPTYAWNGFGYNRVTGDFYRIEGTDIQVWRRGFRSLGANPPRAVPAPGISATRQRPSGLVDIDYSVTDADSATVTTALVAYRGGSTLIRDLVVLRADQLVESTAAKVGANGPTGTSHRVTWNPASSGLFSGDLVFEALARDDRPKLIDLDFITLPGTTPLTISRSPLLNADFRTLWAWLLATGDAALTRAADGEVVGPGGTFTSTNGTETRTTFPGRAWLLAKLGVREATFDELQRARLATSTSGSPNRFTPAANQRMGEFPKAVNEWTFDTGDYGADAWWVVPVQ